MCLVFVIGQTGLFSSAITVFLFLSRSPGGLFHWNVQDLQRVNRPDRPGRVDWRAEGAGDWGQAQRAACSVHCRRRLREGSRKTGKCSFHASLNGLNCFQAPLEFKRTAVALTRLSVCFLAAASPPIALALHPHVSSSLQRLLVTECHIN